MTSRIHLDGTLTVPHATLTGAIAYGRALGCVVSSARLSSAGSVLDVSAPEKALDHLARAHAAGRLSFEPAALPDALREVDAGVRALQQDVRGVLAKRRGGRTFARELDIPVHGTRRRQSLVLDVVVPARLLGRIAHEQALGR